MPGKLSLMRMVELFTTGPARVLGIERRIAENEPADLTIFSTEHKWTFRAEESASKSRNSPFDGRSISRRPHGDHRRRPHRLPKIDHRATETQKNQEKFQNELDKRSSNVLFFALCHLCLCGNLTSSGRRVRRRGACRVAELRGRRACGGSW